MVVDKNQLANLQQVGAAAPTRRWRRVCADRYDEVTGMAYSLLLGQIIQPWFYSQLRTQEQLGYAVFAFPMSVGARSGASCCRATASSRSTCTQRYQDLYPKTESALRDMSEADFEQYKQALIIELKQRPQTLSEEASRFANDFDRGNFAFDTRQKLIAQVQQLTPACWRIISPGGDPTAGWRCCRR